MAASSSDDNNLNQVIRNPEENKVMTTECKKGRKKKLSVCAPKVHWRKRLCEKPQKCPLCKTTYVDKYTLKKHLKTHTGERPHKCTFCNDAFATACTLKKHLRIHTGEKPYICSFCDAAFAQGATLTKHMRTHTGEKPYRCSLCDASFSSSSSQKRHIRRHKREKPHKCDQCTAAFSDAHSLKIHIRSHNGEKPYECADCGSTFSQKGNLINHILIHTGEKPHKCHLCDASFTQRSSLRNHIIVKHKAALKCTECKAIFISPVSLTEHLRLHMDYRHNDSMDYEAKHINSSLLQKHNWEHKSENPCKGQLHKAVATQISKLSKNVTNHATEKTLTKSYTNVKSYKCMLCDAVFSNKRSLGPHIKRHTEDTQEYSLKVHFQTRPTDKSCKLGMQKTYTCKFCHVAFSQKSSLRVHMLTHRGDESCDDIFSPTPQVDAEQEMEKPHKCTYCSSAFARASSLKGHIRLHADDESDIYSYSEYPKTNSIHKYNEVKSDQFPNAPDSKFEYSESPTESIQEKNYEESNCVGTLPSSSNIIQGDNSIYIQRVLKEEVVENLDSCYPKMTWNKEELEFKIKIEEHEPEMSWFEEELKIKIEDHDLAKEMG